MYLIICNVFQLYTIMAFSIPTPNDRNKIFFTYDTVGQSTLLRSKKQTGRDQKKMDINRLLLLASWNDGLRNFIEDYMLVVIFYQLHRL